MVAWISTPCGRCHGEFLLESVALCEAQVDAAGGGEVDVDGGAAEAERVAGPGAGGNPLALRRPPVRAAPSLARTGAAAADRRRCWSRCAHADAAVDGERDFFRVEIGVAPVRKAGP